MATGPGSQLAEASCRTGQGDQRHLQPPHPSEVLSSAPNPLTLILDYVRGPLEPGLTPGPTGESWIAARSWAAGAGVPGEGGAHGAISVFRAQSPERQSSWDHCASLCHLQLAVCIHCPTQLLSAWRWGAGRPPHPHSACLLPSAASCLAKCGPSETEHSGSWITKLSDTLLHTLCLGSAQL